jgi:hypothetical protein
MKRYLPSVAPYLHLFIALVVVVTPATKALAQATGYYATVGGGLSNTASGSYATVAGGGYNTASGNASSVNGGVFNTASGFFSTVAGGGANTASGSFSFAAGCGADTNNQNGSFVWADSGCASLQASAANQFVIRASGGAAFYSNSSLTSGVQLAPGAGSWSSVSDRNAKENFASVNTTQLLAHVLALPITTWNYKSQAASIRHMGPMAQDFYSIFNVGEDDKHITEIDEGGVALAAIQGLNQKLEDQLKQKDSEITALREQLRLLSRRLSRVKQTARHAGGPPEPKLEARK